MSTARDDACHGKWDQADCLWAAVRAFEVSGSWNPEQVGLSGFKVQGDRVGLARSKLRLCIDLKRFLSCYDLEMVCDRIGAPNPASGSCRNPTPRSRNFPKPFEQNPREQQDASHVDILISISISTLHWSVLMLAVICIFMIVMIAEASRRLVRLPNEG